MAEEKKSVNENDLDKVSGGAIAAPCNETHEAGTVCSTAGKMPLCSVCPFNPNGKIGQAQKGYFGGVMLDTVLSTTKN